MSNPEDKILIRSAVFRNSRESIWLRLDEVISKAEKKGISSLSYDDLRELPLLYRSTLSSLSVAKTIVLDRNLLLYLENLSLRAYLVIYGPNTNIIRNLKHFLMCSFPKKVMQIKWHILLSFLFLFAGILSGYIIVKNDISYFYSIVPEYLAGGRGPESTAEDLLENEIFQPWPGFVDTFIIFANSLFRHNASIGVFCFSLGFALGLPTMLILIYNGMTIGAFIALHSHKGLTLQFVGWLMIHGFTEILAILLCAASGFVIAHKIIFPDKLSRLDSLSIWGKNTSIIVMGCVVMFFIAGLLEGGFRQLINFTSGRYVIGFCTVLLWYFYFFRLGREDNGGFK